MADLRIIEDFPKKGVTFVDISPKLADKDDFSEIINKMCDMVPEGTDYIIGPESRGYIFAAPVAIKLGIGFVPIRKKGKLPDEIVYEAEYEKEYGTDIICIPKNDKYEGKNFYVMDDVLATGGTFKACKELINKVNGNYVGAGFYINIKSLNNEDVDYIEEF